MVTTYDPAHPEYLDEADVRNETSRVFDVCNGCRRCVDHCTSFPTLFGMLDALAQPDAGPGARSDAGMMTPSQQDQVVDECFLCTACTVTCPYTPDLHELRIDVPRLVLRARAMRHDAGHTSARRRAALRGLTRTALVGRIGTATASWSNPLVRSPAGSIRRRVLSSLTGASALRSLPTFATQRFSTWFASRPTGARTPTSGPVVVFPTCLVEYHDPGVGTDLVRVLEHLGTECSTTSATCCGAPWLYAGDTKRFAAVAGRTVAVLADAVRSTGAPIVVGQSACAQVLREHAPGHVPGPDAELVAERTVDVVELLADRCPSTDVAPAVTAGAVPSIVVHGPSRPGRPMSSLGALLERTGAAVTVIEHGSGLDGTWGLRSGHDAAAAAMAERLVAAITQASIPDASIAAGPGVVVVGDDLLANLAIEERTGTAPRHPVQVIACALGLHRP